MRSQHRRFSRRGFTLIEMMMVVGIVGILGMVAIFTWHSSHRKSELRGVARETMGKLQLARSMSVNNNTNGGLYGATNVSSSATPVSASSASASSMSSSSGPIGMPRAALPRSIVVSGVSERVVSTELRIATNSRLELWTITDQGNQNLQQIIDLRADNPSSTIEIAAPVAPAVIRYKNGVKDAASPSQVDLVDRLTGKHTFIDVGVSGVRLRGY